MVAGSKARSRKTVERAFRRFVELVKPIPQVRHVVGWDDNSPGICTFIDCRDEAVCKAIFDVESRIMDQFLNLNFNFDVIYLEGRPVEDFVRPLPELVFTRS